MEPDADNWDALDPQQLRAAFGRLDPVPPGLMDDLSRAFAHRRHDTELARLSVDDAGDPSTTAIRRFVFESERCSVTAVLSAGPDRGSDLVDLDGTVEPALPAALVVETPERSSTGVVDGRRIHVDGLPHGPVRLCLVVSDESDGWLLETEWVTV